jgi:hypothetical protein
VVSPGVPVAVNQWKNGWQRGFNHHCYGIGTQTTTSEAKTDPPLVYISNV